MLAALQMGGMTERPTTVNGHLWQDSQRWFKSAADRVAARATERSTPHLPAALKGSFDDALPRMQLLTPAQRLIVAGELRAAFQRAHAFDDIFQTDGTTTGQALALAGAVMASTHGLLPYATQYRAAWLILQGHLAEMATGEGKTVVDRKSVV